MAGAVSQRLLTPPDALAVDSPPSAAVRFGLARPADEADLRALLRDNPMPGRVSIALTREPDFFAAAAAEGHIHQAIVARDTDTGRAVALGCRSVADAFIVGRPAPLGYLGTLRVDRRHRGRPGVIRRGYAMLRRLHDADRAAPFYLTSIVAGNRRAEALLTSGRAGLPAYRPVDAFATLALPTRQRRRGGRTTIRRGTPAMLDDIAALLDRHGRRFQFARRWTADAIACPRRTPNLSPDDFLVATRAGRAIGCLAVWDQRPFRQAVAAAYAPSLARLRRPLNCLAPLLGTAPLPPPGQVIAQAAVSHVAVDDDAPAVLCDLLSEALSAARPRLDYLALGLSARHPALRAVRRRFAHRRYDSRLYVVHWPDGRSAADALDDRIAFPEVALL